MTEHALIMCREPRRHSTLDKGHEEGGSAYANAGSINDCEEEYFIECKYRSSWGEGKIDLSSQFMRYYKYAQSAGKELFIALGVGGTPTSPEEFLIVPVRMIGYSKSIEQHRFKPCYCDKSSEAFHKYITNYFAKRVPK